MSQTELLGRELARQVHILGALREEKKMAMTDFKLREQTILKEIERLALDVRTGQANLFTDAKEK